MTLQEAEKEILRYPITLLLQMDNEPFGAYYLDLPEVEVCHNNTSNAVSRDLFHRGAKWLEIASAKNSKIPLPFSTHGRRVERTEESLSTRVSELHQLAGALLIRVQSIESVLKGETRVEAIPSLKECIAKCNLEHEIRKLSEGEAEVFWTNLLANVLTGESDQIFRAFISVVKYNRTRLDLIKLLAEIN